MARILVIDDQEPIRRVVRRALEQDGHEVFDASDGEIGMDILETQAFDVVITDIFMPGQDGIVTLRQIRKRDDYGSSVISERPISTAIRMMMIHSSISVRRLVARSVIFS